MAAPREEIPMGERPQVKTQDFAPLPTTREHETPWADRHSDTDGNSTATNSSDEFDWDRDDESTNRNGGVGTKAKRGRAVYMAWMALARPFRVFLLGLVGAGIFITPLLVVEFHFKENPARIIVHVWSLWLSIIWAAGCITYLVVDGIPRFVIAVTVMFGGEVENLQTQLELTFAVRGWLKLILDVAWAWISLGVIRQIYNPPGNYWVIVNRVIQALFSASAILLVEKIFLQFVAISFHRKALADRIADNKLGLKALDRLSNATPVVVKKSPYGASRGHKSPGNSIGTSLDLTGLMGKKKRNAEGSITESPVRDNGKNSPVLKAKKSKPSARANKRRKAMASIIVDQVTDAVGQVTLKNSKFNREGEIGGLHSARKLARKLFSALNGVYPPRDHLVPEDFHPYFSTTAEAHAAFMVFDQDGNEDITKVEMREAVQRIYRERKALIASLKDVGSAVAKLDGVLITIALVLILFVCLLIFNRANTLASLVPLATLVLGFSFIFGPAAARLFESLLFIFSTHVFDVGDLVMIDDQPLFVKEFGLFATTFRRTDGQEIIAPNALLSGAKLIHNLRRSNSMWETTNLMISYSTSMEIVEQLRVKIGEYVAANSREWSGFALNIDKMEYQNAIWLVVAMEHRPNWQDWGGRWARRTQFMRNLKIVLEELDIRYSLPVQPVVMPEGSGFGGNLRSPRLNVPRMQPVPGTPTRRGESRETLGNAGGFGPTESRARPQRMGEDSGGF